MTVIIPEPDSPDTVVDAVADTAVAVAHAIADVVEVIEQRETINDLTDDAELTRLRTENETLRAEVAYERGLREGQAEAADVIEAAAIVAEIVAEEVVEEISMAEDTAPDTIEEPVAEVEDKTPDVKVETQEDYDNKESKRRKKLPYGRAR